GERRTRVCSQPTRRTRALNVKSARVWHAANLKGCWRATNTTAITARGQSDASGFALGQIGTLSQSNPVRSTGLEGRGSRRCGEPAFGATLEPPKQWGGCEPATTGPPI